MRIVNDILLDRPKIVKTQTQAEAMEKLVTKGVPWKVGERYYVICSTNGVEYRKIS